MLRSLYSGISGMKVNQTKLDVIGNNIANSSTTAYKAQRARFSTTLSQTVNNASAPTNNQGGINASQVGLGVQLASIDSVMTNGNLQSTGRSLDVAIDQTGYFIVSSGPVITGDNTIQVSHTAGNHEISANSLTTSGSSLMYTRDGSFILDQQGNLLTSDGYRIMGYSLTNDDSSQAATSKSSNNVSCNGMTFVFGPGSQLNGYKVVLGNIGPGTTTTAKVDKTSKEIIINADLSESSTISTEAIQTAIDLGLASAGVSQRVTVTGTPTTMNNLGTDKIAGGSDSVSPDAVAFGGFTINFTEGSELNGYKFQIGRIDGELNSVNINTDEKTIILNADFINGVTSSEVKELLNTALSNAGFEQQIKSVSGTAQNFSNVKTTVGEVTQAKLPTMTNDKGTITDTGEIELGKFNLTYNLGSKGLGATLNGYTMSVDQSTDPLSVSVDKTNKKIVISGDANNATAEEMGKAINKALKDAGLDIEFTVTDGSGLDCNDASISFANGVNYTTIPTTTFAGFSIEYPEMDDLTGKSDLEGYTYVLADVNQEALSINVDTNSKQIIVSGNFTASGMVNRTDFNNKLNTALQNAGIDQTVKVTGSSQAYTGLKSDKVTGGTELSAPNSVSGLGLSFEFTDGAELNGYKIVTGTISQGTTTSVDIDTKNNTITVNGDFVSGNLKSSDIVEAINNTLNKKGISQSIKSVTGNPIVISGAYSEETNGGTPVQSLAEDGSVYFVDATAGLAAYDNTLKSLKIPDTVKIPGTNEELAVVSYTIDSSGIISGVLEDGSVAALGQIAMATFKNQEGLNRLSGNLFTTSVNSGEAIIRSGIGTLGEDNSLGYGEMVQGYLEMSNVDLAEQFTEMITATRAFQASSKMINTGDEILQDIINLKR